MLKLQRDAMTQALATARMVAQKNQAMPIYATVMLTARPSDAWVSLTAAHMDSQIVIDVDADVEKEFAACVDAERFSHAIASCGGDSVAIKVDGERVVVRGGGSVFKLAFLQAANFPLVKSEGEIRATLDGDMLPEMVASVLPYCGDERHPRQDSRGVDVTMRDGLITVQANTGHWAARHVREANFTGAHSIMLGRRMAEVVAGVKATKAIFRDGYATLLGPNMQLVAMYLASGYPDTSKLFSSLDASGIVVDRKEFLAAVKVVASFATTKFRPIDMTVNGGTLTMVASTNDGESATVSVGCAAKEDVEASFLSELLVALASGATSEKIDLCLGPGAGGGRMIGLREGGFTALGTSWNK